MDASYVVKTGSRIARALGFAVCDSKQKARTVAATFDALFGSNGDLSCKYVELYIQRDRHTNLTLVKSQQDAVMVITGSHTG